MAIHDISLFFYIKGSKDFPSGHGIDEKFGFDRAIPTTGFLMQNYCIIIMFIIN